MAKEQTGMAGEFWFFSQLHRLGYEAYITFGNTKGIDITLNNNNKNLITFDKKQMNFAGSFQYLNIEPRPNHYVVY
ncbi:MAG: hypothetical protein IPP71_10060 [Bacteroidetes bacterium]|nr:hypothetical protein [Bacteroidota bacterium]